VVHLRSRGRGAAGGSTARWLGVAAAVLVLAGIAGIAVSREDDGDQAGTTASADLESAPEAAEAPATSGAGDRAADSQSEGGAAMAPAPVEVGDLGGFASPDDLVDAVGSLLPDARPAPDAAPATGADGSGDLATSSCAGDGAVPGLGDTAAATLHGRAVVDGDAVEVWVVATAAGDRVVAIDASCRVVVDRTLP
ncbi:MAG TPA: hypothetical protein VFI47_23440, partial [Acidimicrobiales bacterium]|nr:hypothetical protein [Acidimicrobiales bacterium]